MNLPTLPKIWDWIVSFGETLAPARISMILAVVMPYLFLRVDQGFDILCALGDPGHQGPCWGWIAWFYAGVVFFGLMNWYGPRFLLNCDFGPKPHNERLKRGLAGKQKSLGRFETWERHLCVHVPRILGTLPICLLGMGFLYIWHLNAKDARRAESIHFGLAIGCFATAALLYIGFILRRSMLNRWLKAKNSRYRSLREVKNDGWALLGLGLFAVPAIFLGVAFTRIPVPLGQGMGSGGVLLISLASWSCYGGLAIYLGSRYRLPTLGILALMVVGSSFSNDNHEVRSLPESEPPRETLVQSLVQWHSLMVQRYPKETSHPMFVVASEGGGVRAGYWTALVLATLEDGAKVPGSFSDHLFAISGVSGGSLGAAAFDVLLAENPQGPIAAKVRPMLGRDFLGPLAGKMFLPDLAQRFLPWPFEGLDRAEALEGGWERADGRFAKPFTELFAGDRRLPALFLNGTEMESGSRIITSSVDWQASNRNQFTNALDGVAYMGPRRIRLSTAVHASARFTYFSPAGRYPGGTHVVDGGYFDNSGGETARDILKVLSLQHWADVKPVIIVIQNGPEEPPLTDAEQEKVAAARARQHEAHELLAPIETMLNVRTAHSDLARGELEEGYSNVPTFELVVRGTVLPLGWTLSPGAIEDMEFQVDPWSPNNKETYDGCTPDDQKKLMNSEVKASILAKLSQSP